MRRFLAFLFLCFSPYGLWAAETTTTVQDMATSVSPAITMEELDLIMGLLDEEEAKRMEQGPPARPVSSKFLDGYEDNPVVAPKPVPSEAYQSPRLDPNARLTGEVPQPDWMATPRPTPTPTPEPTPLSVALVPDPSLAMAPRPEDFPTTLTPTPTPEPDADKLDLNTATEAQLAKLPGLDMFRAKLIVEYRDIHGGFRRLDEMQEVFGISVERFLEAHPHLKLKSPRLPVPPKPPEVLQPALP